MKNSSWGKASFDTICAACNVLEEQAKTMLKLAEELSAKGLRVIAVAKGTQRSKLVVVGLAGIADRIREDSREILDQIRELGVEVKMLTGDSLPIAKNIAQQIGLGKTLQPCQRYRKTNPSHNLLTQQSKTHMASPKSTLLRQIHHSQNFTAHRARGWYDWRWRKRRASFGAG